MDIKKRPIRQSLERLILPAVVAIFVILPFSTPLTVFFGISLKPFESVQSLERDCHGRSCCDHPVEWYA